MSEAIRLLCADDHPLLRQGIAALVEHQPDIDLVAEAATGVQAVEQFRRYRPDVTLMDLQMPDMSGLDAIIAIRSEFPAARIVVLTTYAGDVLAKRTLSAGAQAYVLKGMVRRELLDTVRAIHAGHKRINPQVALRMARHTADEPLSSREIDVLRLVCDGNSNKRIARQLLITEGTVKSHVNKILVKLGANDRTHAATVAFNRGILGL
jgi:DNA-binding NarL/FixJ family response regulator